MEIENHEYAEGYNDAYYKREATKATGLYAEGYEQGKKDREQNEAIYGTTI